MQGTIRTPLPGSAPSRSGRSGPPSVTPRSPCRGRPTRRSSPTSAAAPSTSSFPSASGPVTVNEVAERFEIHRNAAKHHLDRLLEAGPAPGRVPPGQRPPGPGRRTPVEALLVDRRRGLLLGPRAPLRPARPPAAPGAHPGRRARDRSAPGSDASSPQRDALERPDVDAAEGVQAILDGLGFRPNVETDDDGHICGSPPRTARSAGWPSRRPRARSAASTARSSRGVLEGFGCRRPPCVGHSSIAGGQGSCVREAIPLGPPSEPSA